MKTRLRKTISLIQGLPLLIWLVLLWGILWQDFSLGNLAFGLIIAVITTKLFYLPPVELSGRFNILYAIAFIFYFIYEVVVASFQTFWAALTRGPAVRSSVVAVTLRTQDDLIVAATGHVISLIPGSLVLEVDRSSSTIYLHCLGVTTAEQVADIRREVLNVEAWVIRIMGSKADLETLRSGYVPLTQTKSAYEIAQKPADLAPGESAVPEAPESVQVTQFTAAPHSHDGWLVHRKSHKEDKE